MPAPVDEFIFFTRARRETNCQHQQNNTKCKSIQNQYFPDTINNYLDLDLVCKNTFLLINDLRKHGEDLLRSIQRPLLF